MLTTRYLYFGRWYTPRHVSFLLGRDHGIKCSVKMLYKVLRDGGVIDENNTPLPPYDDRRAIDVEVVRIPNTYTRSQRKWHDKLKINPGFIRDIIRMLPDDLPRVDRAEFEL